MTVGAMHRARSWRGARLVVFWVVCVLAVLVDQVTKAAARASLVPGQPRELVLGVLDLSLVKNAGAAFSIGEGAGPVFVVFAVVVLSFGIWLVWSRDALPMPLVVSVACVCGGGVGNMIDRMIFGCVTDFFAAAFVDFPVFNVADVFITVGIAVSVILYLVMVDAPARAAEASAPSGGAPSKSAGDHRDA
ncbi:MAG: signal peptidase II [Coriobacteriaceae bacterium]|nr:signal peptidase II [Coriobacteriaceae bacterium]